MDYLPAPSPTSSTLAAARTCWALGQPIESTKRSGSYGAAGYQGSSRFPTSRRSPRRSEPSMMPVCRRARLLLAYGSRRFSRGGVERLLSRPSSSSYIGLDFGRIATRPHNRRHSERDSHQEIRQEARNGKAEPSDERLSARNSPASPSESGVGLFLRDSAAPAPPPGRRARAPPPGPLPVVGLFKGPYQSRRQNRGYASGPRANFSADDP